MFWKFVYIIRIAFLEILDVINGLQLKMKDVF